MSELEFIRSFLRKTAQRRRWESGLNTGWRAALAGAVFWLILLLAYKLLPVSWNFAAWGMATVPLAMVAAFAWVWLRPSDLGDTAKWLDARTHSQERLSTAWELGARPEPSPWGTLVITDAAERVRHVELKRLLPLRLPTAARWLLLVLILVCSVNFVPEYRSKAFVQKKRETEVMREAGKQLAELVRRNLDQRPPALPVTRAAMENVAELATELERAKLTRSEALKDLANITERLKQEAAALEKNPVLKKLEQAARTSRANGAPASTAELQQRMESLEQSLPKNAQSPEELEKFQQQLEKAKQAAADLAKSGDAQNAGARAALAQALSGLRDQAKEAGLSADGLEAAIAALQQQDLDQVLKDLETAVTDLEQLKTMAKSLEQLQAQMDKLGQDLAQQLEYGQLDAAVQTLNKMIAQLKDSNLTPDQLAAILKDVRAAVDPALYYGKASEFFTAACKNISASDRPSAANALASAADELKKLSDQLADAKSLADTLAGLKQAQMCIGNSLGWAQCQLPRAGRGGKPQRGVGTWAEDGDWLGTPEVTERWDNSGITRPDMDPRSRNDLGDGQLADDISPTKLRGKFSPGSSMPSITLKGVSVKGQSRVAFQEAVMAAQQDAQAALNQDQVPRAYQGAVRDYFDDLKE